MAAGAVTLTFLDGLGNPRTGKFWSSDGTTGGTLSPMPGLLGADGATIASAANPVPVTANAGTNLNTSALALDASVNGLLLAQASSTAGEKGPLVQGAVTTSSPTYVAGETSPLSLDTTGALRISAPPGAPVNVTVNSPPNDVRVGPTTLAAPGTVAVSSMGAGSVGVVATGTNTGVSFLIQGTIDGTTWFDLTAYTPAGVAVTPGTPITGDGEWIVPASGWEQVQVDLTAISTGSIIFNLNASAGSVVPPGAAVTLNAPPNDTLTGPVNVTGANNVAVNSQGSGAAALQITGTFTGLVGTIQGSVDGVNYLNIGAENANTGAVIAPATTVTAVGLYVIPAAGYRSIRYHVTAVSTGTAVVNLNASAGALDPPSSVSGTGRQVNVTGINGSTPATNNGTSSAGSLRVNIASDNTAFAVNAATNTALRTNKAPQVTTITASTAETTIVTAVSGHFLDLYGLILANSGATATTVAIKDSTAGTTRAELFVPAGDTRGFMLPMDSGIPQASTNNNWTATCGSSTSSLIVTALTNQV